MVRDEEDVQKFVQVLDVCIWNNMDNCVCGMMFRFRVQNINVIGLYNKALHIRYLNMKSMVLMILLLFMDVKVCI